MADAPPIDGLLEAALYVDNVEQSVRFYQALFGFTILGSDERLCALGVAGKQVLLVCRRTASATLPKGSHDAEGRQHVAFAIPAAEFQTWQARLELQGVAVEQVRQWDRGGRSLYFRDPDGHLIELASPGVWSIY
jgi:catechol 2,3-dioxygenase-like lactoylglutathione lyase family enzyme